LKYENPAEFLCYSVLCYVVQYLKDYNLTCLLLILLSYFIYYHFILLRGKWLRNIRIQPWCNFAYISKNMQTDTFEYF